MELGEKIRLARMEKGLSQRQLCGDRITRNMLSQIEHGTARPSMDTLRYLAERLGIRIGYFLEEQEEFSPNQHTMELAWQAWQENRFLDVREQLKKWNAPDPVFDREREYLLCAATLSGAAQAIREGRYPFARELLEEVEEISQKLPGMERQRLLLLGTIPGQDLRQIVAHLPSLDEELLLRAEAALNQGDMERAAVLLDAAEQQKTPQWNLLRGRILLQQNHYAPAAVCLEKAEEAYPERCWPMLETCFRELGNYQKAYLYACKQR